MSFHTWHEYGYGIVVDSIKTTSERVKDLLSMAPEFNNTFNEYLKGRKITMELIDDYGYDDTGICGLATILASVIDEKEDIPFYCCTNFEGSGFLMYIQTYPWYMSEKEKKLTTKDIDDILTKYIKVLTDEEVYIDYQECENGG